MSVQILPYLLAVLVGVAVFRASGAFNAIADLIAPLTNLLGIPADVLPLMLMRPCLVAGHWPLPPILSIPAGRIVLPVCWPLCCRAVRIPHFIFFLFILAQLALPAIAMLCALA